MTPKSFPGIPEFDPNNTELFKVVKETFDGEEMDVIYRKGNPGVTLEEAAEKRKNGEVVNQFSICPKFRSRTYTVTDVYPHIQCRQDIPVEMRDGITIYADIYTPKGVTDPLPLIIAWGPFGKRPNEGQDEWKLMGVPPGTVSNMSKFEACDPAYWCHQGYAVANVDPRGVGHSGGDMSNWGLQDGRDGYDFIEWAAEQDWCNGRCALFGNSGVAMVQWRIAAEQPPHLACFAAWEGTGDMYRESYACGGITSVFFNEGILQHIAAPNYIEEGPNALALYPFMNKYWESKIPRWENIKAPVYMCACWSHIHLRGSFEAFRRVRSPKKWMCAHREFEWPDTYNNENLEDLKKFYDRYLKDIRNGWEFTPRVRLDVQDAYEFDAFKKRPEKEFPIARTEYKKLYIDAAKHTMSYDKVAEVSELEYDGEKDIASFGIKFNEDTEITGYMKLHLNIECRGHDNMDMFVWIKKYKADGEYVPVISMDAPYRGAWGYFRGQRRELDPKWSSDFQPVQAHRKDEPMEQGVVYPVDIEIWPHSRFWHKGEELRVEISGRYIETEFPMNLGFLPDNGEGKHVIHSGGEYESYLQIPVIPPKYVSGDYEFRG